MNTDRTFRSALGRVACALALPLLVAACEDPRPTAAEGSDPPDAAATALDSLYGTPAPANVRVTRVEIEVPFLPTAMDGFRVAAISDLALSDWQDGTRVARAAIERAMEEDPQMIALLGGFFLGPRNLQLLTRVLEDRGDIQTVAVLSAGDLGDPTATRPREELIAALGQAGVEVLRNRRISYIQGEDTLWIAGLDGDAHLAADWRRAEMIGAIGAIPPVHLLLTHSPVVAPRFPENRYGMVMAGGTACGRIGIPGRPLLRDLQEGVLQPFIADGSERYFAVDGNPLFITCGVGHTFLPTRLAGPAEVALLTLRATPVEEEIDEDAAVEETEDGELGEPVDGVPQEPAVEP